MKKIILFMAAILITSGCSYNNIDSSPKKISPELEQVYTYPTTAHFKAFFIGMRLASKYGFNYCNIETLEQAHKTKLGDCWDETVISMYDFKGSGENKQIIDNFFSFYEFYHIK